MPVAAQLVPTDEPLDVAGHILRVHAYALDLRAERARLERAAEVHEEAVGLRTVGPADLPGHQPDVGRLEAGAGVGAAVDVDVDVLVEVGEALLELGVEPLGAHLRLADRELAELDAGASHDAAAERARPRAKVLFVERLDQ